MIPNPDRFVCESGFVSRCVSRLLGQLDVNVIAFDRHGKGLLADLRRQTVLPVADVVLPAVPGTRHSRSVQLAGSHRAAGVGADAVHRVKLAVHIKERDDSPRCSEFRTVTWFDIRHTGDSDFHPDALCFQTTDFKTLTNFRADYLEPKGTKETKARSEA